MQAITTIVLAVQMLTAIGMIGLILLQHGKGADMGAAFGSGASGSLFGATGSANFLSRTTAILAAVFFACTLLLAYFSHSVAPAAATGGSVLERTAPAPAVPASAAASGAGQIPAGPTGVPSTSAPAAPAAAVPAAPAASGAAQIPTK
ncbi:preprotein translocase subunit SecG [Ramlibacter sp. XY19]|uniref:preprotein translocase subunit SecG n=1 Tax=Ramlibacter paludis TaxID=2908000 RepID=UPI0023DA52E2|nr:preprotein translocase subunit SecG [Ramlibacter paludis]MCG2594002.1 preprotein translocase subunit SecG [Ramlibacter paludis]